MRVCLRMLPFCRRAGVGRSAGVAAGGLFQAQPDDRRRDDRPRRGRRSGGRRRRRGRAADRRRRAAADGCGRHPPHGRRRIALRQRRLPAALDEIGVDDRTPGRRHDRRRDRGGEPAGQAAGRPHVHARRRRHRRLPVRGRRAVPPLPRRPLPAGRARGHRRVHAPPRSIPTWSTEPASTARRRARPNTCWARSRWRRPPS